MFEFENVSLTSGGSWLNTSKPAKIKSSFAFWNRDSSSIIPPLDVFTKTPPFLIKSSFSSLIKFVVSSVLITWIDITSDVFNNSTDGVAAQLETLLESFTSASGSISASQQRLDDNILQINDQLSRYDERLERRRIQLTNEFAKMQELMASLARQQSFMGQFFR